MKVTFRDGDNIKAIHGIPLEEDNNFINLRLEDGRKILINKSVIIKVIEK